MEELWFKVKYYLMKFAYLKKRSRLRRYLLPIFLVLGLFYLVSYIPKDYFLLINSQTLSLLIFILIVAICSWYGGLGPGIFATVLTAVVNYFTLLKQDFPHHSNAGDLVITTLYIVVGLLISIVSEARYEAEIQKDEFVGLTTHELKNPLTVIKGFAGLLNLYSRKLRDKKIAKYTEEIELQADRLLELINDLLDVNKLEVGKFNYKFELFDFDNLVRDIVSHQRIINKNRLIEVSGESNLVIKGDSYRIGQVIANLLTNASKYSPLESPIEVKIKKDKQNVQIAVKDYGLGISKPEQKKIFNQYYRTRNTLKGRTEGLGLGLYICKTIINNHKGKIWVKSSEKIGSTFYFTLPITNLL